MALPLRKAVVLLLRVARASNVDRTQPACDVAEACGRRPLLLTIVGTFMTDLLPRRCLTEDYAREVIYRISGRGVAGEIYERVISESFRRCRGPDPDQVSCFFHLLAVFPEDCTMPVELFATMPCFFGASSPSQVRDWLKALADMSLVEGSFEDGFSLHDEIRTCAVLGISRQ